MAKSKKINKECECCGKQLKEVFPLTKYCTRCSLFKNQQKAIVNNLKNKIKYLEKKLYGDS